MEISGNLLDYILECSCLAISTNPALIGACWHAAKFVIMLDDQVLQHIMLYVSEKNVLSFWATVVPPEKRPAVSADIKLIKGS